MKTIKDIEALQDTKNDNHGNEYRVFMNRLFNNHRDLDKLDFLLNDYNKHAQIYLINDLVVKLRREQLPYKDILEHFHIPTINHKLDNNLANNLIDFEMTFLFDLLHSTRDKIITSQVIDDKETFEILQHLDEKKQLEYLNDKGFLNHSYTIKTFHDLLQDFLTFTRYSLFAIYDEIPQIAYALIRRPFIDDIHYFERMLVDSNSLIKDILKENPKDKEVSIKNQKEIFNQLSTMSFDLELYADVLHIRIDDSPHSIKTVSDKSLHISTSRGDKKNKSGELNFIYVDEVIITEHINFYYSQVTFLLPYISRIIALNYEKLFDITEQESKSLKKHYEETINKLIEYTGLTEQISDDKEPKY